MNNITSKMTMSALVLAVWSLTVGCDRGGNETEQAASSKNVVTLTEGNFNAEVLSAKQPVLVDFWAIWCGPCKVIAPVVAELAVEFEGRAKVGKVDIDSQPALAQKYGISAIPTLLIFRDGKPVDQVVGVQSKAELKSRLEKAVAGGGS